MILVIGYPAIIGFLREKGYTVDAAADGRSALDALRQTQYDVVVVDDGASGAAEFLQNYKELSPFSRVLVVSANGIEVNRLRDLLRGGAQATAVDYIPRREAPNTIAEQVSNLVMHVVTGDWSLNMINHTVTYQGRSVVITQREAQVFRYFLLRPRHWMRYSEVVYATTGELTTEDEAVSAFKTHIHRLRKKLKELVGREVIRSKRYHGLYLDP